MSALAIVGVGYAVVLFAALWFAWGLCRAAAMGDEQAAASLFLWSHEPHPDPDVRMREAAARLHRERT